MCPEKGTHKFQNQSDLEFPTRNISNATQANLRQSAEDPQRPSVYIQDTDIHSEPSCATVSDSTYELRGGQTSLKRRMSQSCKGFTCYIKEARSQHEPRVPKLLYSGLSLGLCSPCHCTWLQDRHHKSMTSMQRYRSS